MTLYIGIMSGTSLDGLDIAIIEQYQATSKLVANHYIKMPTQLHDDLLALCRSGFDELAKAAIAEKQWTELAAKGINELLQKQGLSATDIRAIGSHGQTVRHEPSKGFTIQLSNGALLAELTQITVVTDFRRRDVAAGGQGAPLVPAYHEMLFAHPDKYRAILNIGGFSNLSILSPDQTTYGFDCGPGNVLLDTWITLKQAKSYDNKGCWAASADPSNALLALFLTDDFFSKTGPKSTGREYFNADWLQSKLASFNQPIADEVVQSTLLELTVQSITRSLTKAQTHTDELVVCGGGAFNDELLYRLQKSLPNTKVQTTSDYNIPPEWIEAMAFAWLAHCCLEGIPTNRPAVTGAKGLRILGAIYPA